MLDEYHQGVPHIQYVWSPVYVDALVLRDRNNDANPDLEERLYVIQDVNWNVTAVMNPSGGVLERYTYDVYGTPTARHATTWAAQSTAYAWQYGHQGGRFEAVVSLYEFRFRWFSPALGRWVQEDPIEFQAGDPNFYREVGNNPTNVVDPSGLEPPAWMRGNQGGLMGDSGRLGRNTCRLGRQVWNKGFRGLLDDVPDDWEHGPNGNQPPMPPHVPQGPLNVAGVVADGGPLVQFFAQAVIGQPQPGQQPQQPPQVLPPDPNVAGAFGGMVAGTGAGAAYGAIGIIVVYGLVGLTPGGWILAVGAFVGALIGGGYRSSERARNNGR